MIRFPRIDLSENATDALAAEVYLSHPTDDSAVVVVVARPIREDVSGEAMIPDFLAIAEEHVHARTGDEEWGADDWAAR